MLSNHNTTLVNELYKDFNIHIIEAKRNINSNGKKRGKVEEVIITNFENKKDFEWKKQYNIYEEVMLYGWQVLLWR